MIRIEAYGDHLLRTYRFGVMVPSSKNNEFINAIVGRLLEKRELEVLSESAASCELERGPRPLSRVRRRMYG